VNRGESSSLPSPHSAVTAPRSGYTDASGKAPQDNGTVDVASVQEAASCLTRHGMHGGVAVESAS
jgi:hypothetical protein